jgi:Protein of unknown function (DUF3106)
MRLPHALLPALLLQLLVGVSLLSISASSIAQATTTATAPSLPGRPLWSDLTEAQQQALAPLTEQWPTMNEPHKRKWLALSQNFSQLSADGQSILQSRMREWAALSPQKRTAARLNFAGVQQLPQDDKKAKWEAYQALSPEAKRKLAAQQPQPVTGAAPVTKPVAASKLVPPPAATANKPLPRIATDQLAPITLLPNTATPASVPPASTPAAASSAESTETSQ